MYRRFRSSLAPSASPGFTAVELTVAVVISLLMVGVIVSFMLGATDQFAVSTVRGQMNVQLTSATNRIENDMQYSRLILAENSVADSAAPSNDNRWNSGSDQLVLGATARNSANEPLSADYTTSLDNYIYYLNSGTLYRRVLAFSNSNNRYTTATCAQTLNGGCASDTAILRNIDSLEFTYYDNSGTETSDYTQASSIKVSIVTKTKQSRHEIELKGGSTFRLVSYASGSTSGPEPSTSPIPTLPSPLTAGYGGITLDDSSLDLVASLSNTGNVSTYGNLSLPRTASLRANIISASHRNCGTGSSYGSLCPASPAAVSVSAFNTLVANTLCTPSSPGVTNNSSATVNITNRRTDCVLPTVLPIFNKQALIDTIPAGNTSPGQSCSWGGNLTLQANHRYNGNVSLSYPCSATVSGNGVIYITGNLTIDDASLAMGPTVTSPVTFVVDGRVSITNFGSVGNSNRPMPSIISFRSSNSSCSTSTSCNTLSASDLYSSRDLSAINISSSSSSFANIYAPFAKVSLYGGRASASLDTQQVFGQSLFIEEGYLNFRPL